MRQLSELGVGLEGFETKLIHKVSEERSQCVIVSSKNHKLHKFELREIYSIAWKSDGLISSFTMRRLFKDNGINKFGSWQIVKIGNGEAVIYSAMIGATSDAAALESALRFVLEAADEMENEITGEDEY